MPSRAFYEQTLDGCLSQKPALDLLLPPILPVDTESTESDLDLGVDDWDQWMKWEAPTTKTITPIDMQYCSTAAGESMQEKFPTSIVFDHMAINNHPSTFGMFSIVSGLDLEISGLDSTSHLSTFQNHPYVGHPSLTIAEVHELRRIAMPYDSTTQESVDYAQSTSVSSPELETTKTTARVKKRKLGTRKQQELDFEDSSLSRSKKNGHNAIEKRYRTNLNEKIVLLRQSVPSLMASYEGEIDDKDEEAGTFQEKEHYGKAAIIARAVDYIIYLENKAKTSGKEADGLNMRVIAFEKLAMSGSLHTNRAFIKTVPNTETLETIRSSFQQSSQIKAEKIKADQKRSRRVLPKDQAQ